MPSQAGSGGHRANFPITLTTVDWPPIPWDKRHRGLVPALGADHGMLNPRLDTQL